jgi:hypothetical protein
MKNKNSTPSRKDAKPQGRNNSILILCAPAPLRLCVKNDL